MTLLRHDSVDWNIHFRDSIRENALEITPFVHDDLLSTMMFQVNLFDEKTFSNIAPQTVVLFNVYNNTAVTDLVMVHIPTKTACLSFLILLFWLASSSDAVDECQISKGKISINCLQDYLAFVTDVIGHEAMCSKAHLADDR